MDNKTLGKKIWELRMARGLTQEELAKKAGLGKTTIQRVENETQNPYVDTLKKISNALDVEVSILTSLKIEKNLDGPSIENNEEKITSKKADFDSYASAILLSAIAGALLIISICFECGCLFKIGGVLLTVEAMLFTVVIVFFAGGFCQGNIELTSRSISLALIYGTLLFLPFGTSLLSGIAIFSFLFGSLVSIVFYLILSMRTCFELNYFKLI